MNQDSSERYGAVLHLGPCMLGVMLTPDLERLAELRFLPPSTSALPAQNELAEQCVAQVRAYLENPNYRWQLALASRGSNFQQRVWQAIAAIPVGQTLRYGDLAKQLGSAARAVGQACGANPFPLVVPCHRVVSSQGLGGFANAKDGWLIATKRWLLAHERAS